MVRKIFAAPLDLKKPSSSRSFDVVEGDSGNVIIITLTDMGLPVDLSGCKVLALFSLTSSDTAQQDSDGNGITINGNVITIDLWTTSMSPGIVMCELQIYSGKDFDTLVTTARFSFTCNRSIVNDDTIKQVPQYPILLELISNVQTLTNGAQSDWTQTESAELDYIKNKPAAFAPTAHAASHADGGNDEVIPAKHALRHATGGADALAPADIGAVTVKAIELTLPADGWAGEIEPYTQTVAVPEVTADTNTCHIVVAPASASQAEYGQCEVTPYAQGAGSLAFRSLEKPENTLTINVLILI